MRHIEIRSRKGLLGQRNEVADALCVMPEVLAAQTVAGRKPVSGKIELRNPVTGFQKVSDETGVQPEMCEKPVDKHNCSFRRFGYEEVAEKSVRSGNDMPAVMPHIRETQSVIIEVWLKFGTILRFGGQVKFGRVIDQIVD